MPVLRMIDEIFSWLPIATVVDECVLIVHGGLSEAVNLEFLATIERHKVIIDYSEIFVSCKQIRCLFLPLAFEWQSYPYIETAG